MSTASAPLPQIDFPPTDLPEEDGVPLESDWHRLEMTLLIELVTLLHHAREDYFVGGNLFIYFDAKEVRNQNFRSPHFFFVRDVALNPPRKYWAVWNEGGRYPDVIIELSSPSPAGVDFGIKKKTYEKTFRVAEYFIYDPEERKLHGWRLNARLRCQAIPPNDKGWLWSEVFELWLGKFQGIEEVYLRFFDKDGNMIPLMQERGAKEQFRAA